MQKKLGLVLAGGGGKGSYQIGVWKYLNEIGLTDKIEVISGTSVGGLNAALMAQGDYANAEKIWMTKIEDSIVSSDEFKIPDNNTDGFFDREKLKSIMKNDVDLKAVANCKKKIYATCIEAADPISALADLEETTRTTFLLNKKDSSSIINILMATSAIPGIFPSVYYNGKYFIDGGTPCSASDNIPVTPLYEENCTDAIVICLSRNAEEVKEANYPKDKYGYPKGHKKINQITIIPSMDLGDIFSGTLNFTPESVMNNIELGYNDAKRLSKSLQKLLEKYTDIKVSEQYENISEKEQEGDKKMIESQKEIVSICTKLDGIIKESEISEDLSNAVNSLSQMAKDAELLIPVIGPFSAGKSTMLNTLLGNHILPENITPTTSLATELHYSDSEEYIEAYKPDGKFEKLELSANEMNKLTQNAEQFSYVKLFLKNQRLQELEPLVLVDMPGFDSPNEAHNKAILNYIDRGLYYIVLQSAKDGTIGPKILRKLVEIDSLNRKFSYFISRSDQYPTSIDDIKQNIEDILYSYFGEISISSINNKNIESVLQCLKEIEPDVLVKDVFKNELNVQMTNILNSLNLKISSSELAAEDIERLKREHERTISEFELKAKMDIQQIEQRYSGTMVNNIINAVKNALNNATDDIVSSIISGNSVEALINETVRSALVESIQNEIGSVSENIVMDFSSSLKNISDAFSDFNIDKNYVTNMTDNIKNMLSSTVGLLTNSGNAFGVDSLPKIQIATDVISKVAGVGCSLIPVIGPIIGVIIAFLPNVLNKFIFKNSSKDADNKRREEVRTKLVSEVYPMITSKLRTELPSELSKYVQQIIQNINAKYKEMIELQKQELQKQFSTKEGSAKQTQSYKTLLKEKRDEIKNIMSEITKW